MILTQVTYMGRRKLERFKLNAQRRNVIEPGKEIFKSIRGNWRSFFENNNDIVLEIGCGRGEYTTGLARVFPNRNFVGIDIKGARIWKGSSVAVEEKLTNVAFLRTQIQNTEDFFAADEVNEIWITFPDPRPRERDERLRLTHPNFLKRYSNFLKNEGIINFKTDNLPLFEYTLEVLSSPEVCIKDLIFTKDLYNSDLLEGHYGIQTTYEKKFLAQGYKINYLQFKLIKE